MGKGKELGGLLKDCPEYEDYSENYIMNENPKENICSDKNKNCGCKTSNSSQGGCSPDKCGCNKRRNETLKLQIVKDVKGNLRNN